MNRTQSKDHKIGINIPCLALMIKYTFKIMDMMDELLVIRVNYKKTIILITIKKQLS